MSTILLTRPKDQIPRSRAAWESKGVKVIDCPLTTIEPLPIRLSRHHGAMWIVTSVNGVKHGLCRYASTNDRVIIAGAATREAAIGSGFTNLDYLAGTAADLSPHIVDNYDNTGKFFHLSGSHIAHDIADDLRASAYDCKQLTCYEAKQAEDLTKSALKGLSAGLVNAIPFYSARALTIFEKLITKNDLEDCLSDVQLCAMSERIAGKALLHWRKTSIAREPTEAALVASLLAAEGHEQ